MSFCKKLNGVYEWFHENGQVKKRINYRDGVVDGLVEWFSENGQLELKGNWKNGEPDGVREGYYNNGQLKIRRSYKKGIYKEGKWVQDYDNTSFWRNGNLQIISEVRDGKYSNKWFDLYTDGKPISKEEFQELMCSIGGCSD